MLRSLRFILSTTALGFGALALAACGPPAEHDPLTLCSTEANPPADGKAVTRLGRGVNGPFQAIQDGDVLPLDYGSQGGRHVWVNIQSYTPQKATLMFDIKLTAADGTVLAQATNGATPCGAAWVTSTNIRVIFQDSYGPLPTGPLTLKLVETDSLGGTLTQSVAVTVQ